MQRYRTAFFVTLGTVSYTHLDVYKRQHLNPDRHALEIGNPPLGKLWQDGQRAESNKRHHTS